MKANDEQKSNLNNNNGNDRQRGNNNNNNTSIKSKPALHPNLSVAKPVSAALEDELSHSDAVWPFYLCLDPTFAKTFQCSECKQIPKTTHAFTSENGYIFCEYCIDQLIETQNRSQIDNKCILQKKEAKVIDNLVKSLRIKCPHCKESQLSNNRNNNIRQQSKSQELKEDEIDDDIQIPPFPTSHVQNQPNNMMNEGVDENNFGNVGIVGIGGGPAPNSPNKKK